MLGEKVVKKWFVHEEIGQMDRICRIERHIS